MKKRSVLFGPYDTAEHGWTLTGITLSDPEQKLNYVEKSGGDGSWDWSTVLTDGVPRYKNRTLTVTLECSEGTREDREELVSGMVNTLDGLEWKIVLPDRPDHYLVGRLHVAVTPNSPAYAKVTVTGNCEPWLYSARETVVSPQTITATPRTILLRNNGRKAVAPVLTIGEGSIIKLKYEDLRTTLMDGVYEWPDLVLTPGYHTLEYLGVGSLTITYREAVLR